MGLAHSAGVWLEDEILQSPDPAGHADGIVKNMLQHRIGWAVVNAQYDANQVALQMLIAAGKRRGWGAFGVWAQKLGPTVLMGRGKLWGAEVCVANPESRDEEVDWSDADLDTLVRLWPNGNAGVCFTEAAWGKNPDGSYRADLAKRWVDRGVVGMPEAIQSENPGATVAAMLGVAVAFGFPPEQTSVTVYLTRGYPANRYDMAGTGGRWSVFRYGDVDAMDWDVIDRWPRPVPPTEPVPQPPPTMTVMEAHANTRAGVQYVRNGGVTLGRAASLTLQDRLALGAIGGKHDATKGAQIANLLDNLGYPPV